MDTEDRHSQVNRRTFLKNSAIVAGGAAAVALGTQRATPARAATTQLRFWHMDYPPHNKVFGAFVAAFEAANPTISIKVEPQPISDWQAKFQQSFISHAPPDILAIHGGNAALYTASGVLAPLDGTIFTMSELQQRFFPSLLDAYSFGGHVYGLPLANNTPGIGFVINVDHFNQAKIEIPDQFASWNEVWSVAEKLTKRNAAGQITRAGLNVREGHQIQYVMGSMLEQGQQYFDVQKGFNFQNPAAYNAIHLLTDAVSRYKVDSPRIADAFTSLANGMSSMGMIYIDYLPYAKAQFPDKHLGFIVRPPSAGSVLRVASGGPWGINVAAASHNKEAALEFVKFCSSLPNLRTWYQQNNALPSSLALIHDAYFSTPDGRWLRKALQTAPNWHYMGHFPIYGVDGIAWPILDTAILGKISVQTAAEQLEKQCNTLYSQFQKQVSGLH